MTRTYSVSQWSEGTIGTDLVAAVKRMEELGYDEYWHPEVMGRETFSACAYLLANTSRIMVSSGIASVYARDPFNAAQATNSLAEFSGGRFRLGLGVSHPVLVEPRGHTWIPPVRKMREFLQRMKDAPLQSPLADHPARVIVAGHGKGLMGVARDHADGSFLFLQPHEAIRLARQTVGPDKEVHAAVRCVLDANPATARDLARHACAFYISQPAYQKRWVELGFEEGDWENGGSDRLIDAICAWGDADQLREKLDTYFEAGASHVAIYPCNPDEEYSADDPVSRNWNWPLLEALAPSR